MRERFDCRRLKKTEILMRNLIQRFRKKDVRKIFKTNKISSKSMKDVLRPIYILSNIFGLRVFECQGHSKPIISFLYTTVLCCLHYVGTFYRGQWNHDTRMYKLDGSITFIIAIIYHIVIFIILIMGLYRSEVSPRTVRYIVYNILILMIFFIKLFNDFLETNNMQESKLCAKKINEIDKTLQALGSPTSFSSIYKRTIMDITIVIVYLLIFFTIIILEQILTNQPLYKSSIVYFSIFLHMYGFMIEFLLVIEFYTIIR